MRIYVTIIHVFETYSEKTKLKMHTTYGYRRKMIIYDL